MMLRSWQDLGMPTLDEQRKTEQLVVTGRWMMLLASVLMLRDVRPISPLLMAVTVVCFYNLIATHFVFQSDLFARFRVPVIYGPRCLDMLLITGGLLWLGSMDTSLWILYLFVIVATAMVTRLSTTMLFTLACSLLYMLCILIIPDTHSLVTHYLHAIRQIPLMFVVGLAATYSAAQHRHQLRSAARESKLRSIFRLGTVLDIALNSDKVVQHILDAAIEDTSAQEGSVMLFDPATKELVVRAAKGPSARFIGYAAKPGEGVAAWVAENEEPVVLLGRLDPSRVNSKFKRDDIASSLSVPMKTGSELIGVLNVSTPSQENPFTPDDMQMLHILANHAAVNIVNARLYQSQMAMTSKLHNNYLSTVQSLARALEARDTYTEGHSQRVMELACNIGRRLRLPESEIETMEAAVLLHDIGKVGIPDHILLKPGKLTDDEYRAIQQHVLIGAKICEPIFMVRESGQLAIQIVRHHHERADGNGYPDGTVISNLPVPVQIVAAADAYDAMTTDRPYRQGMRKDAAIEELRRHAGRQHSHNIVEVLAEVVMVDTQVASEAA